MTKFQQIIKAIEHWAPPALAEPWDNCGLQIGSPQMEIAEVLIALEVDELVLDFLKPKKNIAVITHHPLFFKPLKQLRTDQDLGHTVECFMVGKHGLFSAHTNLDAANGGVNDCLIEKYNLSPEKGIPLHNGFGKVFTSVPISYNELIRLHPCKQEGAINDTPIKKLAFCCGSGHGFIKQIIDQNIDTVITGEITYHDHVTCRLNGVRVISLGHKESELFVLPKIKEMIQNVTSIPISCL